MCKNTCFETNVLYFGGITMIRVIKKRNHNHFKKLILSIILIFLSVSITSGIVLHANAMNEPQLADHDFSAELIGNNSAPNSSNLLRICVEPGDTLWSIARQHKDPSYSIAKYIHQIKKLNQLSDSQIYVGQMLLLP
jgi:hypothetical protein